ncbi:hypothetical protein [Mycoplasmopsis gallinacea]|uniref:Uncharacterized protein n=1 Tax=Mycoplasmopsis gallinacea TaxID=29556 RepID=A0A6H0V269_9BACT|nr:hypothetical protein [Mycoplasmopsis gallinacea]QIW62068.1 hypothetical protein GOQ20_01160 [Mycoplasmopsis gallinacea]
MKENNGIKALLKFDQIARSLHFTYSLLGHTKSDLKSKNINLNKLDVAIVFNDFIKLKMHYKGQILLDQESSVTSPFYYFYYLNVRIYLNLLIPSNELIFESKKIESLKNSFNKKFNKMNISNLYDAIYSDEPDVWIFIYLDNETSKLEMAKFSNINPSYYSIFEYSPGINFPYFKKLEKL